MTLIACDDSRLDCGAGTVVDEATLSGGAEDIELMTGAWCAYNIDQLLHEAIRGDDLLIPGADGVLARDRYRDRLDASIQMAFDGNVDHDGVTHFPLDVMAGLEINRRAFIAAAVTPPASPATFTLSLIVADGAVLEGPLHCEGFQWSRGEVEGMARAVWRVSLPLGLSEAGSS
ncbi:MAG: hypothetical protein ACOC96_05635 [Actinomycetota bacterium]